MTKKIGVGKAHSKIIWMGESGKKETLVVVNIFSSVNEILLVAGIILAASNFPQYLIIAILAY